MTYSVETSVLYALWTALGAILLLVGVLTGAVLTWRLQGHKEGLFKSPPAGAKNDEIPEETQ